MRASLAFLHDALTTRRPRLRDLGDPEVAGHVFLRGATELLDGTLDGLPIDRPEARELAAERELHGWQRELWLGSPFVFGRVGGEAVAAPFLLYPARLTAASDDEPLRLTIDHARGIANGALVGALALDEDACASLERLARVPIDADAIHEIATILVAAGVDSRALYRSPALVDEGERERLAFQSPPCAVPAAVLLLLARTGDEGAVLADLASLSEREALSAPLRSILKATAVERRDARPASPTLGPAERRAFEHVSGRTLAALVGPPGCGKTHTLAALALDELRHGGTVLLAAPDERALAPLVDATERGLGRAKDLVLRLDDPTSFDRSASDVDPKAIVPPPLELDALERRLARLEREIRSCLEREVAWCRANRWVRAWHAFRLGRADPVWAAATARDRLLAEHESALRAGLEPALVARASSADHADLERLAEAAGGPAGRSAALVAAIDWPRLLAARPLWTTTIAAASRLLPLAPLFDLVVFDQAASVDVARPLALAARGRRLVVAGEPSQRRPLEVVSAERVAELAARHRLDDETIRTFDPSERSFLDVVIDRAEPDGGVALLDEQWRSRPALVHWWNEALYDGSVRCLTDRPGRAPKRPPLERRLVAGRRTEAGDNPAEAEAIVDEVLRLAGNETLLDDELCSTIGVLSPFPAQAERLAAALEAAVPRVSQGRHRLRVDTAHGFQGDERDVVLVSFAIDSDTPPSGLAFLERPDVFSVAISRARAHEIVFTSVGPNGLPEASLLCRFLAAMTEGPVSAEMANAGSLAVEVAAVLRERGIATDLGRAVAGLDVDLFLTRRGRSLALELVDRDSRPAVIAERLRTAARLGVDVFVLPERPWIEDRERCLAAIDERLAGSGLRRDRS